MKTKSGYTGSRRSFNVSEKTFTVYANTITNAIYVDLNAEDVNAFYVVYDKKGQVVKENYKLSTRNTISLHPFPSGLYTIKISGRKKTIIKNILKL